MLPWRSILALSCVLALFPACAFSHFAHGTDDVLPNDDRFVNGDVTTDRVAPEDIVSTDAVIDTPPGDDVQPDVVIGIDVQPDLVVGMDIVTGVDVQPDIPPAMDVQPDVPPAIDVQPDIPPAMDVPPATIPPGGACNPTSGPACAANTACDVFLGGGHYCANCGGYGQRSCGGTCREGMLDTTYDTCYRTGAFGAVGGACNLASDCGGSQCYGHHCIECGSVGQGCCCGGSGCGCTDGSTCERNPTSPGWTVCH